MVITVKSTMNINLTEDHYAAYFLTPKYHEEHLDNKELKKVYEHRVHIEKAFVSIAMKHQAKTAPFHSFRLVKSTVTGIHPL